LIRSQAWIRRGRAAVRVGGAMSRPAHWLGLRVAVDHG